jgi:hypothetical protein
MRRLIVLLLMWSVCLVSVSGCGKEPPVVKTEPMHKNRIPTERFDHPKTPR